MRPPSRTFRIAAQLMAFSYACCFALTFLFSMPASAQQTIPSGTQAANSTTPVFKIQTRAVTLDVVVTDSNNKPVAGLTKNDFTILEDKVPQKIASFHAIDKDVAGLPTSEIPRTILLVDELNTHYTDVAYVRYALNKLFSRNGGKLDQPTMLVALTGDGLRLLQDYTRDGQLLKAALQHHKNYIAYPMTEGGNYGAFERLNLSLIALQEIAGSMASIAAYKTIVWISPGFPFIQQGKLNVVQLQEVLVDIRRISDLLLRSRITLDTVDPRGTDVLATGNTNASVGPFEAANAAQPNAMLGDLAFQPMALQTGGKVLFGRNDVDQEIAESIAQGNASYTMLYYTTNSTFNGKFRKIKVDMDRPGLSARTRDGYYALPDPTSDVTAMQQLDTALVSRLPYPGLPVESSSVKLTASPSKALVQLYLNSGDISWLSQPNGALQCNLDLAAAQFTDDNKRLATVTHRIVVSVPPGHGARQHGHLLKVDVDVPITQQQGYLRIVIRDESSGSMGSTEIHNLKNFAINKGVAPALQRQ